MEKMQQNSIFLDCNYSNHGWSLCPVQEDIDDTFSLLYCDLYLRQLKEKLKHTMLIHESIFETQIHELHRLYRKQKELMIELEGTRHHQLISSYQTRNEGISNQMEEAEKSLDSSKMQLDLNEPAKIEEHSDYVFNQFLSSVTTNEIGEEISLHHEGEDSVKAQGSGECLGDCGIDLNMSPNSNGEEVCDIDKFETEKTQESLSVSMKGLRPRKKVKKLGHSNNGLDLDMHSNGVANSESQESNEKGSSCSLSKVNSARNLTNLVKKRRRKRKKTRKVSLVTEGNLQEISAAEIIVAISRKCSEEITSLSRNLLWFAEISSSVVEDCEIKLEESKANLRLNSSNNKTAVSSCDNPSVSEANENLKVMGKLIEASESKERFTKNNIKSSPSKPIEAFTFFVEAIRKRRRGSRIPATDFQHMIINQSSIARLKS